MRKDLSLWRRISTSGLAALTLWFSNPAVAQNTYNIRDLIVVPFRNESVFSSKEDSAKFGEYLNEEISSRLDDDFRLVDSNLFFRDLENYGLKLENVMKDPVVIKGKVRGIDGILLGDYSVIGDKTVDINYTFISLNPSGIEDGSVRGDVSEYNTLIESLLQEFLEDIGYSSEVGSIKDKITDKEKKFSKKRGHEKKKAVEVKRDVGAVEEGSKKEKKLGSLFVSPVFSYGLALYPRDFSDFWGSSFGGGVKVSRETNKDVRLALRSIYRHFGFDSDKFLDQIGFYGIDIEGGGIDIINLGAELDMNLAGSTYNPGRRGSYLDFLVSFGYYMLSSKSTARNEYASFTADLGTNRFGAGAGFKAEIAAGKGSIPIKVEYENIFAGEQMGVLSFDIGYSFYVDKE